DQLRVGGQGATGDGRGDGGAGSDDVRGAQRPADGDHVQMAGPQTAVESAAGGGCGCRRGHGLLPYWRVGAVQDKTTAQPCVTTAQAGMPAPGAGPAAPGCRPRNPA